jgi:GrpB-like predicted nucleotidyltransferase (UPF0157 family)
MTVASTPYRLVEWTRDYVACFAKLRANLDPVVRRLGARVEHVGSTAVRGMIGKPIIDIDIVVPEREMMPAAVAALSELGYRHKGDLGVAGREAFDAPAGLPESHPYVVVAGSAAHRDHVDLREYLLATPSAVSRYNRRKRELEKLLEADPRAYTAAKGDVVQVLLAEARAQR